jgi:polysaccharide deacetylase 2 family uncharacterized protein YibQ
MSHKKRPIFSFLTWLAAALVVVVLAFLLSPPPATYAPKPVRVAVDDTALPPAPIISVPLPPLPPEVPAIGDEAVQPQANIMVPVMPEAPPSTSITKPKIAIVIDDVGLDVKGTDRAIDLPEYVTLSFLPYAPRLRELAKDARDEGHELLLHMPMEPVGHNNPGPSALLTDLPPDEIRQRFENALASFVGFDGVNNHMGSKFTAYKPGMEIVIDELQQRHLFFLDSRTTAESVGESVAKNRHLPTIGRDIFLDDDVSSNAVKQQLLETEKTAKRKGSAVAIGHPHAATLEALEKWLPDAEKRGFTFVPLRTLVAPPVTPPPAAQP